MGGGGQIISFLENTPFQNGEKTMLKELSPLKVYHFPESDWKIQ